MRKHETAVCGTARTVVWEVGKCENRRQMPFMISIYLLPNFLGLPSAHGAVPVSWLRPGVLIAHGGLGLLPCGGRCDFIGNGAGHWSLCATAHYDYFCKTAIIGKSLSWDIKNGAISAEKLSYKTI